jgi:transcription-repair coupling factor (superfamily II helicase)
MTLLTTASAPSTASISPDRLGGLEGVAKILDALQAPAPRPLHLHKLTGAAKALLVAHLRRQTGRPILVVALSEDTAEAFRVDLTHFLSEPILNFPEPAARPYEVKAPHTDVVASRLETLAHLAGDKDGVVVATALALLEQVPGPELLRSKMVTFRQGETVDQEAALQALLHLGYRREQSVDEVGDVALRGGILDVYSLGGENPIRVEIEYGEVASIREFDVHTQRSVRNLESATVLPRHELLLDADRIARGVTELSALDATAGEELGEAFELDMHPPGIERIAARLGQDLGSVLRYVPANTLVFVEEPGLLGPRLDTLWDGVLEAHAAIQGDFPWISPPPELYIEPSKLHEELTTFSTLRFSDLSADPGSGELVPFRSSPPESFGRKIDLWRAYLRDLLDRGIEVAIVCDNEGQRTRLHELLVDDGIGVHLALGVLSAGFLLEDAGLAVLTDHEFFGRPRRRTVRRRFRSGFGLKELRSLKVGAFVVHIEHGIGRYLGLKRLEANGHMTDVLQIEYQGKDKLYVPVDQLDLLQKYSSEEGRTPLLSRIGGTAWAKTRARAKKAVREMAGELIRLYALRKSHPGHAFSPDTPWQRELEGSFPFEETPDQERAVNEVKQDMEAPSPMDRLICGDVGFGKTEVALRAAMKAVQDGKQAAMLVPTTILAEQHYETFQARFAGFPVQVDMLSRFRSPKEQAALIAALADGRLDLVIGTHALLGKRVRFKNLGLLIVDEEQRFGVGHKEKIKQLRANVDVLTLTATPIPRTLNMSLLGVRDITVIQTPPAGRRPVQTEIVEFERELLREALLRETDRGGQSFFVHNRVASIQSMANYVQKLCPQLRVGIAHGQLPEHALEAVMHDFTERRLDVLVSTMIIENGLDIPSVNTMIVNRADAFGLSQLYQLRGRVGRSTEKAFCYFLVPAQKSLTETAMKRLRAIAEFDELGSGFALAMRDLEIRGAGNILGAEQSGHVVSVGFEMYCRLVDEAVRELKGMPLVDRPEPRLTTDLDAFLPDDYVTDAEEKVAFYKRLAEASEPAEVDTLRQEILDRFGRLNAPAAALFDLRRTRLLGRDAGAVSVAIRGGKIAVELGTAPTPDRIRGWMKRLSIPVEFATSGRFVIKARGSLSEALGLLAVLADTPAPSRDKGTS